MDKLLKLFGRLLLVAAGACAALLAVYYFDWNGKVTSYFDRLFLIKPQRKPQYIDVPDEVNGE